MTYEGSATYPGCWETVTWIVMNKPIYITRQEMYALKQLMQGDKINPKSNLAPNSRPIQPGHSRSVRTNIYFPISQNDGLTGSNTLSDDSSEEEAQQSCPDVFKEFKYEPGSISVGDQSP
jgi:hypothetical protein